MSERHNRKPQKTAAELAELVRKSVGKPDLRIAVYGAKHGWWAKVYPEVGENVTRLQALVDEQSAVLGQHYELVP